MPRSPILIVHGGAWAIPEEMARGSPARGSARPGDRLRNPQLGAAAVDAVEAAVTALEDDTTFDAGRGSFLTRDCRVQLDALLMDGQPSGPAESPVSSACATRSRPPGWSSTKAGTSTSSQWAPRPSPRPRACPLSTTLNLFSTANECGSMRPRPKNLAGLPDPTFAADEFRDDKSPETAAPPLESHDTVGAVALDPYGSSLPALPPEVRSTKLRAASATLPSSAAGATPITTRRPSRSRAGANPL